MIKPSLEITTTIGCAVRCVKYCPQELITSKYRGVPPLTLSLFRDLIKTVPKDVIIHFGGFCEPFGNKECADMIKYAHDQGYTVQISSTLVGLKPADADRITKLPINLFLLHLPDAQGRAKIPMTEEYFETFRFVLSRVQNIRFMNMGGFFETNHCEDIARGVSLKRKRGRVMCEMLESPALVMGPNGDVFFCCITRGLSEKVGSLRTETYADLLLRFPRQSARMQRDPASICHVCEASFPYWYYKLNAVKDKVFKGRTLREVMAGIR